MKNIYRLVLALFCATVIFSGCEQQSKVVDRVSKDGVFADTLLDVLKAELKDLDKSADKAPLIEPGRLFAMKPYYVDLLDKYKLYRSGKRSQFSDEERAKLLELDELIHGLKDKNNGPNDALGHGEPTNQVSISVDLFQPFDALVWKEDRLLAGFDSVSDLSFRKKFEWSKAHIVKLNKRPIKYYNNLRFDFLELVLNDTHQNLNLKVKTVSTGGKIYIGDQMYTLDTPEKAAPAPVKK